MNIELPKSMFISFSEQEYKKMNEIPVYAHEKTLEDISAEEPVLAATIIEDTLLYRIRTKPDIQIVSDLGVISSEMDGDSIAFGAFNKALSRNIVNNKVISPMDIIVSTFMRMGSGRDYERKLISIPKFIIQLSSTI